MLPLAPRQDDGGARTTGGASEDAFCPVALPACPV